MMRPTTSRRFGFLGLAAAAVAVLCVATLEAAAPRLIMVHGGTLDRPIVLSDWDENKVFFDELGAGRRVVPGDFDKRPFLKVSLFWGPLWAYYMDSRLPLSELRPEGASQHGRFYPAVGSTSAILLLTASTGHPSAGRDVPGSIDDFAAACIVSGRALEVLQRAGVAVRVERPR